jgi:hypothetical protein
VDSALLFDAVHPSSTVVHRVLPKLCTPDVEPFTRPEQR